MIHVIPLNDLKYHDLDVLCWCGPSVEVDDPETGRPHRNPVVGHIAGDGREQIERKTGSGTSPDKQWGVFEV